MKILFLGYSNLFRKRIQPVLESIPEFTEVAVAKYKDQEWITDDKDLYEPYKLYDSFEQALEYCDAELVYISIVNSAHSAWARQFLSRGFHVIVDKPATLAFSETEELLSLAREKERLLAESTVYLYHAQFSLLKKYMEEQHFTPKLINLSFSFPPLDPGNFRYNKELGGGAIFDTGVYALSPGRFFFDDIPLEIHSTVNSSVNGLITSYSILARYSEGRSLVGHFGFTTEYINRLNILGENFSADIDRVFTTPDNLENEVKIRSRNADHNFMAPKSNMFINFFKEVVVAIQQNDFAEFYRNIYMDSKAVQMIINSTK